LDSTRQLAVRITLLNKPRVTPLLMQIKEILMFTAVVILVGSIASMTTTSEVFAPNTGNSNNSNTNTNTNDCTGNGSAGDDADEPGDIDVNDEEEDTDTGNEDEGEANDEED